MALFIIAAICLGIGAALWFYSRTLGRELLAIKATETTTVKELEQMSQTIAAQLGGHGSFCERVELKGLFKCANPLTAEFSKRPCVYYQSSLTEEYQETYYETDEDGNRESKTRRCSHTVSDNEMQIDFYLQDKTGQILIRPNDAQLDCIEVVDRFERSLPQDAGRGNLMGNLVAGMAGFDLSGNRRILGYRYRERIFPANVEGYVLGEVSDRDGKLQVCVPQDKNEPFLITTKTEEELVRSKEKMYRGIELLAVVFFVLAVALVISSFFV